MIESKKPQNKLMPIALSFKGKKFIHSSKNLLGLGLNLLLLVATMRSAQLCQKRLVVLMTLLIPLVLILICTTIHRFTTKNTVR
jgi:hypothetical protein